MSRKVWGPRPEYMEYITEAKHLFPTLLGHVKRHRLFLCGFVARNSKHVAKIRGNRNPWAILLPQFDYSIEFWDPKFKGYPDEMKIYIAFHELWHIPDSGFAKGASEYRKCRTHDVEEFNMLISVYGINHENVKMIKKGEEAFFDKLGDKGKQYFKRR